MTLPEFHPGPLALDLPGGVHEWATFVAVYDRGGQLFVRWHGGHEHVCELTGPPIVDGDHLVLDSVPHGQLVLRPIAPTDTWLVHGDAGSMTAWEAYSRGLT